MHIVPRYQGQSFEDFYKENKILKSYLGKNIDVIIDRPLGSKHSKWNIYYILNYGYRPNTISGDGEEIDVYVIGEFELIQTYNGTVVDIVYRKDDNE